jgi:arylsulfatase
MLGNRAIYHRGWKAVTYHGTEGMIYDGVTDASKHFDEDRWELYHVEEDFSESHDLADEYPEKLKELQAVWWAEAGRYDVLPLDARSIGRALGRPRTGPSRKQFVYYPGGAPIEAVAAVNVKNRSHTITADVEIPQGGAEGVLISDGGRFGGYSLYVMKGKLCYAYNLMGSARFHVTGDADLVPGRRVLQFSFEKAGKAPFGDGGDVKLYVDGKQIGEGSIPRTVPFLYGLGSGFAVGRDDGAPVTDEYAAPFAFTGRINRVVVDVSGPEPPRDLVQEAAIELARQ